MRRIGVLLPFSSDDAESQARMGAFLQTLALSGWTIGRNVQVDTRWGARDAERIQRYAAELVALAPDVILAHGISTVGPLRQATRNVPIVFPVMNDPVGLGVVDSLARPGGNVTGFIVTEFNFSGKWLELLKQVAPDVTRVAVLQPGRFARPQRHRAGSRGLRALSEWRSDRDGGLWDGSPSRFDHRTGGPAQTARDLFRT